MSSDGMNSLQANKQRRIAEEKRNFNSPGIKMQAINLTTRALHCTVLYGGA